MQYPKVIVSTPLEKQTVDRLERFAHTVNANRAWVVRELVEALLSTNPEDVIDFQNWRKIVLEHLGPSARRTVGS
jgi:hypothetical protein